MTTILVSTEDQRIYCDGRAVRGDLLESDSFCKWFTDADGAPWFYSGSVCDAKKLFEHFVKGKDQKSRENFNTTIYGFKDGELIRVSVSDNELLAEPMAGVKYRCYGSGGDFALAALDHGKSPIDAIEYAKTRDIYTGGKISCYDYASKQWVK